MITVISFKIVLVVLITACCYFIVENHFTGDRKVIKGLLKSFDGRYQKRLLDKGVNTVYKKRNRNTFLDKLDRLVYNSGIRTHLRYMTPEVFIIINAAASGIFAWSIFSVYNSIIFSLISMSIIPVFSYAVLREMARMNFDKIDNQIMGFINALKSNAKIENNIVFMMEESAKTLKNPLKSYNVIFVREVKRGIPIEKAFENYINKVQNIRLKVILKNLYICSMNNADYSKLLDKTKIVVSKYYEQKEKRKKKVQTGQVGIVATILISLFIIHALSNITPNFYSIMTGTTVGQALVGYIGCVIIFAAYKCITLKDFNY